MGRRGLLNVIFFWLFISSVCGQCANFSNVVPEDPHPYAPLSTAYVALILEYLPITGGDCYLTSVSNTITRVIVYNCSTDTNFSQVSQNIADEFKLWGFNVSFGDWESLPDQEYSVTMNFTGDSDPEPNTPQTPVKRFLLLSAEGELGPGVNDSTVEIDSYGSLDVWNRNTYHGSRITAFVLSNAPLNPNNLSSIFVRWFCYREWNVSTHFLNNSGQTQVIINELLPDFVDECANHDNKCAYRCVDGLNPVGGYTCQGSNGVLYTIDALTQNCFNLISTYLSILSPGNVASSFFNVTSSGSLLLGQNNTAQILLNDFIPNGTTVVSGIIPAVQALLAPINPGRISLVYLPQGAPNNTYSIFYSLLQPGQVSVVFSASGNGLADAMPVILVLSGIEGIVSINPVVTTSQTGSTVTVTFAEASSAINTQLYRTAACTFYRSLYDTDDLDTLQKELGTITSVTTTDVGCTTTNITTASSTTGTNSSGTTPLGSGVIIGVVVAALVVIVLAVVLICVFSKANAGDKEDHYTALHTE